MRLPVADDYRRFKLSDGSIIYPSGSDYQRESVRVHMPDAGKFMLWVKDGEERTPAGVMVAFGHFVMDREGPRYFESAKQALRELESIRGEQPTV